MLLSHKYKFIYIKTFKTASTATEISLSRYCNGKNDIITEIGKEFQKIRDKFKVKPKNHIKKTNNRLQSHAYAREILYFVGDEIWNSYTKITTERHPYDRLLSHYYHLIKEEVLPRDCTFKDFIFKEKWYNTRTINRERWMLGNSFIPDKFIKFENLQSELSSVCEELNIPFDGWMPRVRVGQKKDRTLLTPSIKKRIQIENNFIFNYFQYTP